MLEQEKKKAALAEKERWDLEQKLKEMEEKQVQGVWLLMGCCIALKMVLASFTSHR